MSGEVLFDRNMAVFAERFPSLHTRLAAIANPSCTVVYQDGEPVDIDFGSGRLYGGDGGSIAREQAQAFLQSPGQIGYTIPASGHFDSLTSRNVHLRLLEALAENKLVDLPLMTGGHTGFFFILGVGLGYHLLPLLERIETPYVVICEAYADLLLASFRVVDWGALIDLCERRGAKVHVICATEAIDIVGQATTLINTYGPVYLDGSYFYQHYPLWALTEAKRRLVNDMPRHMTALGYFEDERKMVRNVFTNFQKCRFRLLPADFRLGSDTPVFIVGSGPSLDQDMPFIKEWREHALVISAGSGLQPCLNNGIVPDFHVELENSYPPYKKLQFIMDNNAERFPNGVFEGIRLIASATVSPLIPPMFDEVLFFFRDSVTSTLTFGKGRGTHRGTAPTVMNTALATVVPLGVGDVYLFGADCGWRDGTSHHARDTIYYTSDFHKTEQMSGQFTLPGNFGGTVQTDMVFDWCRNILEQFIQACRVSAYNCSDGALIKGATPRVSESLEFSGDGLDRAAVVDTLLGQVPYLEPGEYFRSLPLQPYLDQLDRYQKEIGVLMDRAVAEEWRFRDFHDHFWRDFVKTPVYGELGMSALVHYSLIGIFKHSCIFMNRIVDAAGSDMVTQRFYELFREVQDEVFAQSRENLRQMVDWVENGTEPAWSSGLPEVPGTSY